MPRRVRWIACFSFLAVGILTVEGLPIPVRSSVVIGFKDPAPEHLRLSCDFGQGFVELGQKPTRKESDEGATDIHFLLPLGKIKRMKLAWTKGGTIVVIRSVRFRKILREKMLGPKALQGGLRPLEDVTRIDADDTGVRFYTSGNNPAVELAPAGFERFGLVGRKYLYPMIFLMAVLLHLLLGQNHHRWWKYRELIGNLTRVNLKLKYRGSVLGILWSLLNPILMIVIYSLAFRFIIRIPLENYTFFLLVGLLPFNFFSMAATSSTTAVVANAGLLKKVEFPRETFPISTTLFCFVQFALALVAFSPFIFVWKTEFVWFNLLYFVPVILLLFFALGISFALSALTVLYRDLQHFTEVGMMALFWITPVIYNFELIPYRLQWLFMLNPCTIYTNCFHDLLYWNRFPDAVTWIGVIVWPMISLSLGGWLFRRIDTKFAEVL